MVGDGRGVRQHGRPVYYLTANFQEPEEGYDHQDVVPDVAGPDHGFPMAELARKRGSGAGEEWEREWSALDARYLGTSAMGLPDDPAHPARAQLWIRIAGDPDRVKEWLGLPPDQTSSVIDFTFVAPRGTPGLLAVTFQTAEGLVTV